MAPGSLQGVGVGVGRPGLVGAGPDALEQGDGSREVGEGEIPVGLGTAGDRDCAL